MLLHWSDLPRIADKVPTAPANRAGYGELKRLSLRCEGNAFYMSA